jgi:multimeric flavodoxin WrbA
MADNNMENEPIRVLGIGGSPRLGGNSDILLDHFLKGAAEAGAHTEKILLNRLRYQACQECGGCDATGLCVVEDDMQRLFPLLVNSTVVTVASPIFFSSISAQLKAMIDRCQCFWVARYRLKNLPNIGARGVFLATRGQKGLEVFHKTSSIIKAFFNSLNITYTSEIFVDEVDEKGAILEHPDILEKSRRLGYDTVHDIVILKES